MTDVSVWAAVDHVGRYVIELENDDLDVKIEVFLPASSTTFAVPSGFLAAGTEYDIGIGTVTANGNTSFVETSFTTAE